MLWTDRTNRLAGVFLILLAIGLIVNLVAMLSASDADPFERGEVKQFLTDFQDNKGAAVVFAASNVVVDTFRGIVAAGALFLEFRKRNRVLATLGLILILAPSAAFIVADASIVVIINLASDFKHGGAGDIKAGSDTILEVARAVAIFHGAAGQAALTALAAGIISFSALIAWAPAKGVTPPRWVGWIGILAGVLTLLTWLVVASDDIGGIFFPISGLAQLLWLLSLGGWLVMQPEEAAA